MKAFVILPYFVVFTTARYCDYGIPVAVICDMVCLYLIIIYNLYLILTFIYIYRDMSFV